MLRKNIKFITFIIAFAVIASVFAVMASAHNSKYEYFKESIYNRALNEFIDFVYDINTNLAKVEYASSPAELNKITSMLNGAVNAAKSNLGQLPFNNVSLDKLQKYLVQTSSYVTVLSTKKLSHQEITEEEYSTVEQLRHYSEELIQQLSILQDIIRNDSNIVRTMTNTSFGDIPEIEAIDGIFVEYPTLIYDGPFSDSEEINNYYTIEETHEIDDKKAESIARRFIGKNIKLKFYKNDDSNPAVYSYSCDNAYVNITKKGGLLLRLAIDQTVEDINLSNEDALKACTAFIENEGYQDMTETYYIVNNGILTSNFAYLLNDKTHGEVICYSDLIKIGVALDTGKVCYFDADSYLKNNAVREFPADIIPKTEAESKVNKMLEITGSRLALIPTDYGTETFCYEFSCFNTADEEFLVYINAENGNQENILMILNTDHGTLTV